MKIVIRKGHDEDIDDNYRWNENLKRGIRNDFENLFQEGISKSWKQGSSETMSFCRFFQFICLSLNSWGLIFDSDSW